MSILKKNNIEKIKDLGHDIDLILNDPDKYHKIYSIDLPKAETEVKRYSSYKERAALGNKSIREHLLNQYAIILKQVFRINDNTILEYIDFDNIQNNGINVIFEMLINIYDMSEIIEKYNLHIKITEEKIRDIAKKEEFIIQEYFELNKKIWLLSSLIYSSVYGQDVIDTLQHHNINDIGVIDKDYIYIVYKGLKYYLEFLKFYDDDVILNIQKKTTQNAVESFDKGNPTLITSKDNSSRITVAGFSSTPIGDYYYNERIFNIKKITLEEMRDTYNTINELIYRFIVLNQKGRGSHFVTGSDMGVGKSTFLLAVMEKIPDYWGIGILDTQNELQAHKKYPWKNIITLIENPKRNISQLFEAMLKMSRDILYIGEITKPSEVGELINASLRLNAGVGATLK